ncbi:pyruvate ferredoxin oxidoreductase [Candidatus Woesearchaeota archaeon]|nr:pyruvate ferredoxin oxidoreductase [Candidatus Woesearchaeota archaeon]
MNKTKMIIGKKHKKCKPHKINPGAVVTEPGSSIINKTGSWRSLRPEWDKKKCTQCMSCWMYCPDCSIPVLNNKRIETDFEFCKGCGICAKECIFSSIVMIKEKK